MQRVQTGKRFAGADQLPLNAACFVLLKQLSVSHGEVEVTRSSRPGSPGFNAINEFPHHGSEYVVSPCRSSALTEE